MKSIRWMAATGALIGGLVVGAVGIAAAQSEPPPPTPPPSATDPAPGPGFERGPRPDGPDGPGGPGKAGGPGGHFKHSGFGMGRVLHGEFVVPNGDGYRTMLTQTGKVTDVSSSSITVKSDDGYSKKYAVDEHTSVNSGRDGIADVKKDDVVHVDAVVNGDTANAMRIHDITTNQAIHEHWRPAPPANSNTTPTTAA